MLKVSAHKITSGVPAAAEEVAVARDLAMPPAEMDDRLANARRKLLGVRAKTGN